MAENQATPTTDDKINALTDLVAKLARQVDGMVSHRAMRRADDARDDADERSDEDKARDDEVRAAKDAARKTLFGDGAKKESKGDEFPPDKDEDEDEDKEKKGDEAKADEDEEEDKEKEAKGDESEDEEDKEKKGDASEPEPMASDDDRRKDRKDWESDKVMSHPPAKYRGDDAARSDARADSQFRALQRELADLKRSIRRPRVMTDDELNALAERQQEWDRVAQMHGQRASRPLDGEQIASYDRRLAKTYQKHSAKWKDTDLAQMPIEVVTKVIAPEIRADAISAAYHVEPSAGGMLREVRKADRTGRIISEFVGPIGALNGALAPFRMPSARVRRINTQPNQY